ncbi:serine hydrolase domain-containing protein [Niabella drilacis]|uniref:CubicO group peptidase, beta-lactamase class C family n=1 Tax=Niabella drilacis (strain DSM 25811 / CCM 8410 / CCUG 62505 / LMG 26954 / E90) TaxID=1285928 RepID=A0A1G6Y717_NIADE|nr:serine hydrolase domain-containing protein [Niabella drilacis]SDD86284.1 CubicO group peptidase, beta-lactamase class C family [Niabella drilacis]
MRRVLVVSAWILLTIGCKSKTQAQKEKAGTVPANPAVFDVEQMTEADKARYHKTLSDFFDSALIRRGFNGGILVAKGGNILYESYHGYLNPNRSTDTIDAHTPFHLASTSKPFTAVTVLKLIQDSKIALQDPVTHYFPAFPYPAVTVEQLLSHRSGLPNYLSVMEDKSKWNPKQMVSNDDVLHFLEQYKPAPMFKPGSRFAYCNTNFVMLALIVEKVTGKKFPRYVKETIFDPLQMTHTFIYTPEDSGKVVMSYKPSGALWVNDQFDNTYGDKNVYSTPEDMFKWDRALYNPAFIRQSLLDSAYQPHSHEKPSIHNYGLGWRMLNLPNGKNVIYHNGKWHGFTPAFGRLIDEKAVIIILGNKMNSNMYNMARKAYDFFGDYMQTKVGGGEEEGEARASAAMAMPVSDLKPAPRPAKKTVKAPAAKPARTAAKTSAKKQTQKSGNKKAAPAKKKATAVKKKTKK